MRAAPLLRQSRRRASLSQRELARRAGVPQSTVGRIETGDIDPRASTLNRLLRACGFELESVPRLGEGIDRTQIREFLALTTRQRIESAVGAARAVRRLRARAKRT